MREGSSQTGMKVFVWLLLWCKRVGADVVVLSGPSQTGMNAIAFTFEDNKRNFGLGYRPATP